MIVTITQGKKKENIIIPNEYYVILLSHLKENKIKHQVTLRGNGND